MFWFPLVLASFKAALAIAIIGFMEGISLAKKFAGIFCVFNLLQSASYKKKEQTVQIGENCVFF
jgi:hypothetical protein